MRRILHQRLRLIRFLSAVLSLYYPDYRLNVKLPQSVPPNTYTPTDAEIARLIEFFKKNDKIMLNAVYMAAFGTLRRSEVCAVTADDVRGNRLYVHKALIQSETGEWIVRHPKTYSSTRIVDLPSFVIDGFPKSGRIVPLNPTVVTDRLRRSLEKIGLPHFRFHDLRHYSASIMHAIGIPDQYIMQKGGWQSDTVLKRIYRNTLDNYTTKFNDYAIKHYENMNDSRIF